MPEITIHYEGPIVTRKEAIALGLKRYFTGKECHVGHLSERYVKTLGCIRCNKENKMKGGIYYISNKKAINNWREKNRIKYNLYKREKNRIKRESDPNYQKIKIPPSGPCKNGHIWDRKNNRQCPECVKINSSKNYWLHREKKLQINKEYCKNSQKRKEYRKKYCQENREKRKNKSAEWHLKNKDKTSLYQKERKDIYAAHARNRRARLSKVGGYHTSEEINNLLILQKNKCANCKKSTRKNYHVDHIIPIFLGGNGDKKNLQILCPKCNLSKNRKHPIEWAQQNGRLL